MKKILLADDDEAIVDAVGLLLELEGFEVKITREGTEVHNLAIWEHPDIILLDIWMSGTDGREICRELKADSEVSNIPVLMISASGQGKHSAIDAGAAAFIEKPFEIDDLLRQIDTYV